MTEYPYSCNDYLYILIMKGTLDMHELEEYRQPYVAEKRPLPSPNTRTEDLTIFDYDDMDADSKNMPDDPSRAPIANPNTASYNHARQSATYYFLTESDFSRIGASKEEIEQFKTLKNENEKAELFANIALAHPQNWEFRSSGRIPNWALYDGNPIIIDQAFRTYGENFTTYDKARLLTTRATSLKAEKQAEPEPSVTLKEENGKVELTGFNPPPYQTSANGCWSCSMQMLLQSQGYNFSQEEIRSHRPTHDNRSRKQLMKMEKRVDKATKTTVETPSTEFEQSKFAYDSNTGQEMMAHAEAISGMAKNSLLHETEIMKYEPEVARKQGITREDYLKHAEAFCRKQILHALRNDHSPVSMLRGGHYITVVGIDENNHILYKDSQKDQNKTYEMSLSSLINPRINGATSVKMFWMSKIQLCKDKTSIYGIPTEDLKMDADGRMIVTGESTRNYSHMMQPGTSVNGRMIQRNNGWNEPFGAPELFTDGGIIKNEKVYFPKQVDAELLKQESANLSDAEHEKLIRQSQEMFNVHPGMQTNTEKYSRDLDSLNREKQKLDREDKISRIEDMVKNGKQDVIANPSSKQKKAEASLQSLMTTALTTEIKNPTQSTRNMQILFAKALLIDNYAKQNKLPASPAALNAEAADLRNKLSLDEYPDSTLQSFLSDRQTLKAAGNILIGDTYRVPDERMSSYVNQMKEVARSMMPKEGRTQKYIDFYDAVQNVVKAGTPNENGLVDSEAVKQANIKLMDKLDTYISGKEKVRFHTDGQKRFANALDALSVLGLHAPGLESRVSDTVKKINTAREAKSVKNKDFVDISRFGSERARKEAPKEPSKTAEKTTQKNAKQTKALG